MSGAASGLLSETFPTDLPNIPATRALTVLVDDGTRSGNTTVGQILDLTTPPAYALPVATTTALGGVLSTAAIGAAPNGGLFLGQNGATAGQYMGWNGVAWGPANAPSGGGTTYSFSGLFTVSGANVGLKTGTDGSSVAIGNDPRFAANAAAALAAQTTANAAIPASQKGVPFGVLAADGQGDLALTDLAQTGAVSGQVPQWNGTSWIPATVTTGSSSYVLPTATTTVLGGVKFGTTAGTVADGGALASEIVARQSADAALAPIFNPAFAGTPTAPTPSAGDNSTRIATSAFAAALVGAETSRAVTAEATKAPLASPALTGIPTVPTAAAGTNTTQAASTAFATGAVSVVASQIASMQADITSLKSRVLALEANAGGGGTTPSNDGTMTVSTPS